MYLTENTDDELERIIPKEVPNYPGFYYYPENDSLAISKNGKVLNLKTKKIIEVQNNLISLPISTDTSDRVTYDYPFIIARTFIGRPKKFMGVDYKYLIVEHKDGNINNTNLDNLFWVMSDASKKLKTNGLMMEIKDTITGKVYNFQSQLELERFLESNIENNKYSLVKITTIRRYLKDHPEGIIYENFLIKEKSHNYKWEDIKFVLKKSKMSSPIPTPVQIKNLYTGDIMEFKTATDGARYIGVNESTFRDSIRKGYYKNNRYGNWIVKKKEDTEWPKLKIYSPCNVLTYDDRSIELINKEDSTCQVYRNIHDLVNNYYVDINEVLDSIRNNKSYVKDNIEIKLLGR